jgi:NADPH-dependent curcumin reductase CurA
MTASLARQIVLAARPQGKPQLTDFRLEETEIPKPASGQLLLAVQYLSLDPICAAAWMIGNHTPRRASSGMS